MGFFETDIGYVNIVGGWGPEAETGNFIIHYSGGGDDRVGVWGQISGMLILWGLGLGTDIRDVHILGGVVLCGGFGDRHRDVNMGGGAATVEF